MDLTSLTILAAITFVGALVQASLGFGFAILAAPLFLVVMASTGAIPVLAVLNLGVSAVVAAKTWRQAPRQLLALLCIGSISGFPVGLALFRGADVADLKLATGIVIMAFAAFLLARERGYKAISRDSASAAPPRKSAALAIGALSGIMGAALAMPGPAAMLYLAAARLSKDQSRALSLAFFTFVYACVCLLHGYDGNLNHDRLLLSAQLMVAVLLGAVAGHVLASRLSEARFRQLVLVILFLSGVYAAVSA